MIKLATHGRDLRKDVINKHVKTVNYETVAFNAFAVAIGYMISIKSCNGFMKLPQILSFRMGFAGEKTGQNNMLKWILRGRIGSWIWHNDLPNFVEKLKRYRDLIKN